MTATTGYTWTSAQTARARKFRRAMAGDDLLHDFLLYKTPRPIARRTLLIREEVFDGIVI